MDNFKKKIAKVVEKIIGKKILWIIKIYLKLE